MAELESIVQNLKQEMKRGTLVLAVLTRVDEPQYGYTLITELSELGMAVEQNTLYPLMRRLEKQGLLESLWQIEENRPRRYYQISSLGRDVRNALITEWQSLELTMSKLVGGTL
jgi:DNA-binding PadR family transcriptional regulator